jgi:autotransporter-associated beta strand protein
LIQGNSSGVHTMSVGALNTDSTFSGIIKDTAGTVALVKTGTGTLWLTGANTYTGTNNINAGKLIVSTVSQAQGNYTVGTGATFGVTNTTSSSAMVSNLTVAVGSQLEFQNVTNTTTPLLAASNVTVNGSCTVKITGPNGLVAGNSYPLVSYAGAFTGAFTNLQLQMPYGWRGTLANSGRQISLASVAVVATTAPLVSLTNNRAQLQFGWPATHIGWRLQSETNLTATTWQDVPGASATNLILILPTNPCSYFRMVYP